jgi:citrate lyase subunit beta/citryl-CoA lyase
MRSVLYIPGNNRRFHEKAGALDIDTAILDLEDSVPPEEKESARPLVREAARALAAKGTDVYVRMNSPTSKLGLDDIRAVGSAYVRGFVVPKVSGAEDVRLVERTMGSIEAKQKSHRFEILPLIESAAGVVRSFDIALASPRVVGLVFGAFDYTFDMGISWSKEGSEYNFARQKIPIDARAAGILAIDTVYPDPNDEEGFVKDVEVGKRLGYTGKTIIHPKQIEAVNVMFSPTETELTWARKVIDAYESALVQGKGAILLEGRLVDMVHFRRAKDILRVNDLILKSRRHSGSARSSR